MTPPGGSDALPAPIVGARDVIAVRVGRAEFGIAIGVVREVVHVPSITRLPFPPPSVLGVVSIRGVVLPVVDLCDRLFGTPCDRAGRLVIVEEEGQGEIALLVDAVLDLVPVGSGTQEPPDEVRASLPAGWIGAVASPTPDRLVTLLNLGPVLAKPRPADEESR
jgi:purine-binding chemotaxis protein CheW